MQYYIIYRLFKDKTNRKRYKCNSRYIYTAMQRGNRNMYYEIRNGEINYETSGHCYFTEKTLV